MPTSTVVVCFRPTWRQVCGRAVFLAGLTAMGAVVGVAAVRVFAGVPAAGTFLVVPIMVALVFVAVAGVARGQSVGATEAGLVRGGRRAVAWQHITDIRTERRGSRTVVRVYLDSGGSWRCHAPYDGLLLSGDPEFEQKYFTLRNLWETYRNWGRPGVGPPTL